MPKIKTEYKITSRGLLYKGDLIIREANINKTKRRKKLLRTVSIIEEDAEAIYGISSSGEVFKIKIGEIQ